jgi:hypothetical protein
MVRGEKHFVLSLGNFLWGSLIINNTSKTQHNPYLVGLWNQGWIWMSLEDSPCRRMVVGLRTWLRKEKKFLKILLNLFGLKILEQVFILTHNSVVGVICRHSSGYRCCE